MEFVHKISPLKPLKSVSIFSTIDNIKKLPTQEKEIFNEYLDQLLNPKDFFV